LHFGKISNPKKNTGYNTQNLNFRGVLFGFHSFFHAWLNRFMLFYKHMLKMPLYYINQKFWNFHVKIKMFLNISKENAF
jgi:hypothetical protein